MVGLVRGLVEWVPTSASWAGYVAGPLTILGYLVGSIPFEAIIRRRGSWIHADLAGPALTSLATVLVATVAWDVGLEASPRGQFGAVGTFANQALGAWVSIALWTAMAAIVGSIVPVWTGFRGGGTGLAPAVTALVVYLPLPAITGAAAALLAFALGQRWRVVVPIALATTVAVEYLAWITDTQTAWGVTNGPEAGLWAAVLLVVLLFGRNLRA